MILHYGHWHSIVILHAQEVVVIQNKLHFLIVHMIDWGPGMQYTIHTPVFLLGNHVF